MIGLESIQHLLDAATRQSSQVLLVLDRQGETLYASDLEWKESASELQAFAFEVLTEGDIRSSTCNAGALCGVPLAGATPPQRCLVLLNTNGTAGTDDGADLQKHLLVELKWVVEQQMHTQEEVVKLTEELDHSYENFNLFTQIVTQIKGLHFSGSMLAELVRDLRLNMRVDLVRAKLNGRPDFDVCVTGDKWQGKRAEAFADELIALLPEHAPSFQPSGYIVKVSTEHDAFRGLADKPYRLLAVRIMQGEADYGWLLLLSFDMDEIFRKSEHQLLRSMAEQIALVIANSDLYHELESFVVNMVTAMVRAIEAKDVYTRGHSERVSCYSLQIAAGLGLSEADTKALRWASLLHDIGKIGTPGAILNKPGKVTEGEFNLIKEHPGRGVKMLESISQLSDSLPGIHFHHERLDGSGYPMGLKGDEIPMQARIIAVADTFDAITSTRSYRSAVGAEKAARVLIEESEEGLDMDAVTVFMDLLTRGQILKENDDE